MAQQNINLYDSSLRVQHDWLSAESLVGAVGTAIVACLPGPHAEATAGAGSADV